MINKYNKYSEEEIKEAVKQDGNDLRFVENQTEEICILSVKQNGNALQFVKEQTEEMCILAVKQDGYALAICKRTNGRNVYISGSTKW